MPDDPRRALLVQRMVAEGTSDDDIRATLKAFDAQAPAAAPARTWGDTALDVGKGILKGASATVAGLGEMAANAGALPGVRPSAFNADMRNPVFQRAEQMTTATNTPQMVGKGLEAVGEMALPVGAAVDAIPSTVRAGKNFDAVANVANKMLVDMSKPGDAALRVATLAQHGGGTELGPGPVRQFLQYATNPKKPPMDYEVAREFASNISKLSVNELQKMPPAIAREVAIMAGELNRSIAATAGQAGKGREYAQAMTEYAKAKRLQDMFTDALKGAKQALPYALKGTALGAGAGAAYWLKDHILGGA